jgi:hypothetical protein
LNFKEQVVKLFVMRVTWKLIPYFVLLYWSYFLIFTKSPWILLDFPNLLLHEAGHIIFMFLGQFMMTLGGSFFQCLVPLCIGIYFLFSGQLYSSSFCLFWLGDNLINVSVYINDARTMFLPLLTMGDPADSHDWHNILSSMNLLDKDVVIGGTVWYLGMICVVAALVWYAGLMIYDHQTSSNDL